MTQKICRQFAKRGSCRFDPCRFAHALDGESSNASTETELIKKSQARQFSAWKRTVPIDQRFRPLNPPQQIFTEARKLIDFDEDTLQNVIRALAEEAGLRRVQELVDQKFEALQVPTKRMIFRQMIVPFLEIVTTSNALTSLILEQSIVTIYNCIFGPVGRRGTRFLCFLVDFLTLEMDDGGVVEVAHLELSLHTFSNIVEFNSTAFIDESLKSITEKFSCLVEKLQKIHPACSLNQSHYYLELLKRRLNMGVSLSKQVDNATRRLELLSPPSHMIERQAPGGRHDNDHSNICDIKIMPTFEEINCARSEYLPVKDPRQWHLNGLAGLLDRNFRLLREDMIGQLRDVIYAELHSSVNTNTSNQTRSIINRKIALGGLGFNKMSGLQFLVKLTQPYHTRSMKREEREEWWANSKRLQPSALVCLLDPKGVVVFCTVANPERRKPPNGNNKPQKQLSGSLSDDPLVASVVLELAEPNETNWGHIIDCHFARKTQSSLALVEFPGILLPSFQPTLLALQKMSKTGNLPMSDILAPSNLDSPSILSDVPPPLYATAPGFSFNLKCLMNDSSNLELRPSEPPDIDRLKQKSSLDDAQASALARTIQRQFGLIQGPPGTGKSFTGVALIEVLLANKAKIKDFGPIICVCYTNHALDQLLEDVLENDPSLKIVRIGSQSKSEAMQKLNLRTMVKGLEKTKLEKMKQFEAHSNLERGEKDFQNLYINSIGSDISLKHYLMEHDRVHYNQLFEVDDEGFQLQSGNGSRDTTSAWLSGGGSGGAVTQSVEDLAKVHVNSMTAEERQLLHAHWITNQNSTVRQDALDLLSLHLNNMGDKNKISDELDLRCLRDAAVVGVTTSGLARNMNMLRRLPSKVLICEEAGEVLEAHLLVSILPSIEQVILIGDHQQLRPQVQNYDLSREKESGKQYSLDRSLFERLVDPDDGIGVQLPYATLETQRRMHPSISRLIRETLYPQLHDATLVHDYPEVVGMRKRLFWFDHRHPEAGASQTETFTQSHWNQYEVDMTVSVVNHLLSQGVYQKDDIAVLTPYLGQLHRLRRELSRYSTITLDDRDAAELDKAGFTSHEDDTPALQLVSKCSLLRSLRVATIDNFQGEEAKIVVISLVRSNSKNKTGFLRTPNRINVLLSRAKHGMYIIGNSLTSRSVDMWDSVIKILESEGNISSNLELACPRHPKTSISVSDPNHFSRFSPEGGCTLQCKDRLPCGHPCKQKCHSEILHNAAYCSEPCPRPLKGCSHSCQNRCGDRCPLLCKVPVVDNKRLLPCGHPMVDLPCWQAQDLQTVKCTVQLTKQISRCKHIVTVECHTDVEHEDYKCPALCGGYLPCGHICKDSCWECQPQNVGGLHTQNADCKQVCNQPYFTCSHRCTAKCHGDVPCAPCKASCDVMCGHSKCPRVCSEPCVPCAVPECLSSCPHSSCSMPCAAPCDHIPCSLRCEKLLECGHQCPSVCGEACPAAIFCHICGSDEIKDTPVDFILGMTYREIDLAENPCIFPQCGHFLTIESMDGQMDMRKHYNLDHTEKPISISRSAAPFSIEDIRSCATCRGSLRNLSRYGRLVRRALLDESTKKFILYSNRQYFLLSKELSVAISELHTQDSTVTVATRLFPPQVPISIKGSSNNQVFLIETMSGRACIKRWLDLLSLRRKIMEYKNRVELEEQPFQKVQNMVEDAHRRKGHAGSFEFDSSVLQSKGFLQALSLLLRVDTALLGDFLALKNKVRFGSNQSELRIDLTENRKESKRLIEIASRTHHVFQQIEGNIFFAQFCALEFSHETTPSEASTLTQEAAEAVEEAERLCSLFPGQSRGLDSEIKRTRDMIRGATFYSTVTDQERIGILNAMSREFTGTGHWYYCANGHPFTIGDCGLPMEVSTCPECGAAVGGQNHRSASGVSYADDLEAMLRQE